VYYFFFKVVSRAKVCGSAARCPTSLRSVQFGAGLTRLSQSKREKPKAVESESENY